MLSLFATVLAWPHWVTLRAEHAWLFGVLAITGAIGQWGLTHAFRHTPASLLAPLEYTALVWGLGLDWLLWNTLPDRSMLLGAAVIIVAGLYLLRRERVSEVITPP